MSEESFRVASVIVGGLSVVVLIISLIRKIYKDRQPPPDQNATFKKQFDALNDKLIAEQHKEQSNGN